MAQKHGLVFVPLQEKFNETANAYGVDILTGDGVHPSIVGFELIKREWLKAFEILK